MRIEDTLVERNHNMREFPFLRTGRKREARRIKSMTITEKDLDKCIGGQDPVKGNSKGRRKSSREITVPSRSNIYSIRANLVNVEKGNIISSSRACNFRKVEVHEHK